jgi:hypothetical protein
MSTAPEMPFSAAVAVKGVIVITAFAENRAVYNKRFSDNIAAAVTANNWCIHFLYLQIIKAPGQKTSVRGQIISAYAGIAFELLFVLLLLVLTLGFL